MPEFLERKHGLLVRREARCSTLLRKLLVQEPTEEHEQCDAQNNQHNVEPLRQAWVIERVFHFQDVGLFARSAHGNLHRHRVGIRLHGIAAYNGTHLLRRNQKVSAHERIERCKPHELRGTLGHALGNFLVLHFLDFKAAKVPDKARQIHDSVFGRRHLDFVIEHVAHEHLGVINVRLDRDIEGECGNSEENTKDCSQTVIKNARKTVHNNLFAKNIQNSASKKLLDARPVQPVVALFATRRLAPGPIRTITTRGITVRPT